MGSLIRIAPIHSHTGYFATNNLKSNSFIDRQVLRPANSGIGYVKGPNINEISFAHILIAPACPGSPAL